MKGRYFLTGTIVLLLIAGFCTGCDEAGSTTLPERFTVTFDTDGGNESFPPVEVWQGGTVNDLPWPTKENYHCWGWYTEKKGKGTQFTENTVVTRDITVYPWWGHITYDPENRIVYLLGGRWGDNQSNWNTGDDIILANVFDGGLKPDTIYAVTIGGTSSVEMTDVTIIIASNPFHGNHVDLTHFYPPYLHVPQGDFTLFVEVTTKDAVTLTYQEGAFVHICNQIMLPEYIEDGTVMATITNFSIEIKEKE